MRRGILCVSLLSAAIVANMATQTAGSEFFVLSQPERTIYRIDTDAPDEPAVVGKLEGEGELSALVDLGNGRLATFDATSNSMLVFDVTQARVIASTKLDRELDAHVRGFDMDSKGTIYGVFPGMKLAAIDSKTGETKVLCTLTGASRVEAIAFGPGDRLFASGSDRNDTKSESLYRVDLPSGKLERVGRHGFSDIDTLTFGGDTFLYGTNSRSEVTNEILRISPRGRKGEVVGDTGVRGVNGVVLIGRRKSTQ